MLNFSAHQSALLESRDNNVHTGRVLAEQERENVWHISTWCLPSSGHSGVAVIAIGRVCCFAHCIQDLWYRASADMLNLLQAEVEPKPPEVRGDLQYHVVWTVDFLKKLHSGVLGFYMESKGPGCFVLMSMCWVEESDFAGSCQILVAKTEFSWTEPPFDWGNKKSLVYKK